MNDIPHARLTQSVDLTFVNPIISLSFFLFFPSFSPRQVIISMVSAYLFIFLAWSDVNWNSALKDNINRGNHLWRLVNCKSYIIIKDEGFIIPHCFFFKRSFVENKKEIHKLLTILKKMISGFRHLGGGVQQHEMVPFGAHVNKCGESVHLVNCGLWTTWCTDIPCFIIFFPLFPRVSEWTSRGVSSNIAPSKDIPFRHRSKSY